MASQRVVCGHCDETMWVNRCDGCERTLGRDDPQLTLGNFYPRNFPEEIPPSLAGRQLHLCNGCATGGVDLLRLMVSPPKSYPDLVR